MFTNHVYTFIFVFFFWNLTIWKSHILLFLLLLCNVSTFDNLKKGNQRKKERKRTQKVWNQKRYLEASMLRVIFIVGIILRRLHSINGVSIFHDPSTTIKISVKISIQSECMFFDQKQRCAANVSRISERTNQTPSILIYKRITMR